MCLCGNLALLKESGQYSTLAPEFAKRFKLSKKYTEEYVTSQQVA